MSYACYPQGLEHWFTDISCLAMDKNRDHLPFSLGFRTQALTLKRVSARTRGKFIRPSAFKTIIAAAENRTGKIKTATPSLPPAFRENIGETFSLIYAPFYQKNGQLYDGVLDIPVPGQASGENFNFQNLDFCRPEKETLFLSGLCPACGWDLNGHAQSLVLVCTNCQTLWQPRRNKLDRIRFQSATADRPDDVLIPFWKISAQITGFSMASYADLARQTNLPKAIQSHWENQTLYFWAPAFKTRPKVFLRMAQQLLIKQPCPDPKKGIQKNHHLPITLPASEAVQSIKIILASLVKPLKENLPDIASAKISPKTISLVFLPFETGPHDYLNRELNLSMNRKIMDLSEHF